MHSGLSDWRREDDDGELAGAALLPPQLAGRRAALVVAHPGHELRVHGWLELARPIVCVLTDGSGHGERSRLPSTSTVLQRAGARAGAIYGRFTDRALYSAIIDRDFATFTGLAEELAEVFVRERIAYVAGDAVEGYNPVHDVCRLVTGVAVDLARVRAGEPIVGYDFPLVGRPDVRPGAYAEAPVTIRLDERLLQRKLDAAAAYPELAGEVELQLQRLGRTVFAVEHLYPYVAANGDVVAPPEDPPYYERYGEGRVAAGVYDRVLRYGEHMRPLADVLYAHVEICTSSPW